MTKDRHLSFFLARDLSLETSGKIHTLCKQEGVVSMLKKNHRTTCSRKLLLHIYNNYILLFVTYSQ